MRLNAKQIENCTGGTCQVQPIDASAIMYDLVWDSREVKPGYLYVALPGQRVDGHDFVAAALRAGALGALVMQPLDEATLLLAHELGAAIIEVPDTTAAITDLAREWRKHIHGTVIGITGSTGKTTTKNLVRDVLAAQVSVVATVGNQNNELGVPKTLLAADPDTQAIVVEMGMRGSGQIAQLCSFVRPDWGVITNVGESHIELLGSRENIARAKAELLEALPKGTGVAFLNGADDMTDFLWDGSAERRWSNTCVRFDGSGCYDAQGGPSARWRDCPVVWAEDVELDNQGRPRFMLCVCGFAEGAPDLASTPASCAQDGAFVPASAAEKTPTIERELCTLGLRGLHNVANACAAAAVGRRFGMSLDVIAHALEGSVPEAGRQEVLHARAGFTVINDAYNANPDSMRASLSMFCALAVVGRRFAVLGDMGELGESSQACHEGVGEYVAGLPIDCLVCVGELADYIAQAAERAGMPAEKIVRAHSIADVLGELEARVEPGDAVLVKASHFMGLTRVVEGLVN